MSLLKRSRKHMRERQKSFSTEGLNIFDWMMMHRTKKPSIQLVDKVVVQRRWDEMPHDILVDIMMRLGNYEKTYTLNSICKSWLYAVLDSIFPPGDVLDLRVFDQIPTSNPRTQRVYEFYLRTVLKSRLYTKVFFPHRRFRKELYEAIAKRLPELQCVVVHRHFCHASLSVMVGMFCYWPKLVEAHFHVFFVRKIVHCKEIRRLLLYGWIRNDKAFLIANELPQLEYLDIQSCVLSSRALTIILDGQKELKHLDTKHAARFDDKFLSQLAGNPLGKAIVWNEEEIRPKVARIETYLECPRKFCHVCANFYDVSVSKLGLRAWSEYWMSNCPNETGQSLSTKCGFGSILPCGFAPIHDDMFSSLAFYLQNDY